MSRAPEVWLVPMGTLLLMFISRNNVVLVLSQALLIRAIVCAVLIGNAGFHCLTPLPVSYSNEETNYLLCTKSGF